MTTPGGSAGGGESNRGQFGGIPMGGFSSGGVSGSVDVVMGKAHKGAERLLNIFQRIEQSTRKSKENIEAANRASGGPGGSGGTAAAPKGMGLGLAAFSTPPPFTGARASAPTATSSTAGAHIAGAVAAVRSNGMSTPRFSTPPPFHGGPAGAAMATAAAAGVGAAVGGAIAHRAEGGNSMGGWLRPAVAIGANSVANIGGHMGTIVGEDNAMRRHIVSQSVAMTGRNSRGQVMQAITDNAFGYYGNADLYGGITALQSGGFGAGSGPKFSNLVRQVSGLASSTPGMTFEGAASAAQGLNDPRAINMMRMAGIAARDPKTGVIDINKTVSAITSRFIKPGHELTRDNVDFALRAGGGLGGAISAVSGGNAQTEQALRAAVYNRVQLGNVKPGDKGGLDYGDREQTQRAAGAAPLAVSLSESRRAVENQEQERQGLSEGIIRAQHEVKKAVNDGFDNLLEFLKGESPVSGPVVSALKANPVTGSLFTAGKAARGVWDWASNKAKERFAEGGAVPGDHHNDTVDIRATPGEVVVPRHKVLQHGGAGNLMRKLGFSGAGRDGSGYAYGGEVTGDTDNLHPEFMKRLKAWSAAVGQPYNVGSGHRSIAEQQVLYDRWLRRVPGQAKAAKPGSSNHNFGLASDGPHWGGKNPGAYGLRYPMSFEPWHVEPVGALLMRGNAGSTWGKANSANPVSADAAERRASKYATYAGGFSVSSSAAGIMGALPGIAFGTVSASSGGGGSRDGKQTAPEGSPRAADAATAPANASGNVGLGKRLAAGYSWNSGKEWDALYQLWQKESNWNHTADNPNSSAYGIPQALIALHKMPPGYYDTKSGSGGGTQGHGGSPEVQINWGLKYIKDRYGSPSAALAYHQRNNSYSKGTMYAEDGGRTHAGEIVVPAGHAEKLRTLMRTPKRFAEGGAVESESASSPAPARRGGGGNVAHISVTLNNASVEEARKFAMQVRQFLESDTQDTMIGSS